MKTRKPCPANAARGLHQGYADALRDVQEAVQGLPQGLAQKGHVADT